MKIARSSVLKIWNFYIFFSCFSICGIDCYMNSLIRLRLKALHFESPSMIDYKASSKYDTSDEGSQHLSKLMRSYSQKTNLDLTFSYDKYSRLDFSPPEMLKRFCSEFENKGQIQPLTNMLFLINDDVEEGEMKHVDRILNFILYLSATLKIPVITWFPDRVGQIENAEHSMALRLEPTNWHIARAIVDFMQAYKWDVVSLLISNGVPNWKIFLKEFKNVREERSKLDHPKYFPYTISHIFHFDGIEISKMLKCSSDGLNCLTIKSLIAALEKLYRYNERVFIFHGNKAELIVMISFVQKYARGPKRYLLKLFGEGYLWICSPAFTSPLHAAGRNDIISSDSIVVKNWLKGKQMSVAGMFFLACLNHYTTYKDKAELVRQLWQRSLIKLMNLLTEKYSNRTEVSQNMAPKNLCVFDDLAWKWGRTLYKIMRSESFEFKGEHVGFMESGAINTTEILIFNSKSINDQMKWFKVGSWSMSSKWGKQQSQINIDGVTWPGGTNNPPKGKPDKFKMRVITIKETPFVFYGKVQETGQCDAKSLICRVRRRRKSDNSENTKSDDDEEDMESVTDSNMIPDQINDLTQGPEFVNACCAGFAMDLLKELSNDLNFDVDLSEVPDGKWGGWTPEGWNGLVKVLKDGKADMVVTSFKITPNRSDQVDFSVPFMETGIAIIVSLRKGAISPTAFLKPYDYASWCVILVFSVHASGAALFIYEWISPNGLDRGMNRSTEHKFSLCRSLWLIWSMLFGAAVNADNPRGVASRFLANIWALFALVFLASYTANLAAFMIAKDDFYAVSGIRDELLVNPHSRKPVFRFATVPSGATEESIRSNFPKMHEFMKNFNKSNIDDGIRALKIGDIDAFLYDSNVLEYKAARDKNCKLKTVGNLFAMTGYGIAFPQGSVWRHKVNDLILQYQKDGKLQRWKKFWMSGHCTKYRSLDITNKTLGVTNFISAFILLLAGMVISCLLLVLEHIFYRCIRPKIKRLDKYGCCGLISLSMGQFMEDMKSVKPTGKTERPVSAHAFQNQIDVIKKEKLRIQRKLKVIEPEESEKNVISFENNPVIKISPSYQLPVSCTPKQTPPKDDTDCCKGVTYTCDNHCDLSKYCSRHLKLYYENFSQDYPYCTITKDFILKYSNCDGVCKRDESNNDMSEKNEGICSEASSLPNNTLSRFKIIKSKLPKNMCKFPSTFQGAYSPITSSWLKRKRKKNEMLVKESCL